MEKLKAAKTSDAVIAVASSSGYPFAVEDLNAYAKSHSSNSDLADEQLDDVKSGTAFIVICTMICSEPHLTLVCVE